MAKQKPLQAVQALALLHFSVRVTARPPKMAAQTIPASSAATKIKFRRQKLKAGNYTSRRRFLRCEYLRFSSAGNFNFKTGIA